jgi:hypothetical protein
LLADPEKPITLPDWLIVNHVEDPARIILDQKTERIYRIKLIDHVHHSLSFTLDHSFTAQQFLQGNAAAWTIKAG